MAATEFVPLRVFRDPVFLPSIALHKKSFRGSAATLAVSLWLTAPCTISSRLCRTIGEALAKESSFGKPKAYRKGCGRAGKLPIDFLCKAAEQQKLITKNTNQHKRPLAFVSLRVFRDPAFAEHQKLITKNTNQHKRPLAFVPLRVFRDPAFLLSNRNWFIS